MQTNKQTKEVLLELIKLKSKNSKKVIIAMVKFLFFGHKKLFSLFQNKKANGIPLLPPIRIRDTLMELAWAPKKASPL